MMCVNAESREKGKNDPFGVIMATYYRGFDDCLDVILSIIVDSKSIEEMKSKVEHTQILVKGKKLDDLRRDLGVIGETPF